MIRKKSAYFDLEKYWPEETENHQPLMSLGPMLFFRLFILYTFNVKSCWHFMREIKRKII